MLAVGVVTVAALYFGREVLLPITLALLLSFVLSPLVSGLRKLRIPDVIAVVFSVAFSLGIVTGVATLVGTQVVDLAANLPKYQTTIDNKVQAVRDATLGKMAGLASRLQTALGQPEKTKPAVPAAAQKQDKARQEPVPVEVHQPPPDALSLAQRVLAPVLHPLATAAIVFIVAVFVLLQRDDLRDRLIRLFGTRDLHRSTLALDDAAQRLSRFFLTQLGVNVSFGIIIATGLYFIGLPSPLLWGTMAGLLRFVPYIGSYMAAAGPILVAAAVEPGWDLALWAAALFLATEPVIGQFIEPLLYGRSTGLSPISVVISAIFWGWLWGPVGLIISTPLTLCLVVLGQHVEQLEFLQVLLGDRPALMKKETFYQRLLAQDEDDLQEQAEEMLREISLTAYYDDVAIPGLELAAGDLARGVLARSQVESIASSVISLVAELKENDSGRSSRPVSPENERQIKAEVVAEKTAQICCIAARTPLDLAAATMLAHLLEKEGLRPKVVSHEDVSRGRIGWFNPQGLSRICVCYIDASGSIPPLRFLLRRLRQRLAVRRIVVAIWPRDHPLLHHEGDELDRRDLVASLRSAVDACLESNDELSGTKGPAARAEYSIGA